MSTDTLIAPASATVCTAEDPADFPIGIELSGTTWRRIRDDGADFDAGKSFFDLHPIYAEIRDGEIAGLAMIRIPLFFVRTQHLGAARRWLVSATPREGYVPHPAFVTAAGGTREHIHVAQYQAGKGPNTGGDGKPVSAPGEKPWTRLDFDAAGKACAALGEGWRLWSIHDLSAIQLLMLIEMGGPDMQALIGMGNVDSHGPVGGGESDASWRGLCELWGNVWQMLDGLAIDKAGDIRLWRCNDGAGDWVDTNIPYGPDTDDGYPTALHHEKAAGFDLSLLFLPSAVTDEDEEEGVLRDYTISPYGDWRGGAWVGGGWGSGRNAGPFCLVLDGHRSGAGARIGFRPAFAI